MKGGRLFSSSQKQRVLSQIGNMDIKNKIAGIKAKIGREAANVLKMSKKEKCRFCNFLAFTIMFQNIMPAVYASGLSEAVDLMSGPIGIVTGVVSSLGAVMILVAIAQYMMSDDPQAGAQAKNRIKIILIAWVALLCTTLIANMVISVAEIGFNDLYNGQLK